MQGMTDSQKQGCMVKAHLFTMTLNDFKGFDNSMLGCSYLVVWLLYQSIGHVYCLHCTAEQHCIGMGIMKVLVKIVFCCNKVWIRLGNLP